MKMYTLPMGLCPACNGNKIGCNNCGGQYMYSNPKGEVPLRPDGTPCLHEYTQAMTTTFRSLHKFNCKHCHDSFTIDSGG